MTDYQKVEVTNSSLPAGTNTIGNVKLTDGTETASVNAQSILDTSSEHSLKGKTILYDTATAQGTTGIIRTVTAGKTYYLIACGLSYYSIESNLWGLIYVEGALSGILRAYSHVTGTYNINDSDTKIIAFPHPLPIAAGKRIFVIGQSGNITAYGWIMGWEE